MYSCGRMYNFNRSLARSNIPIISVIIVFKGLTWVCLCFVVFDFHRFGSKFQQNLPFPHSYIFWCDHFDECYECEIKFKLKFSYAFWRYPTLFFHLVYWMLRKSSGIPLSTTFKFQQLLFNFQMASSFTKKKKKL